MDKEEVLKKIRRWKKLSDEEIYLLNKRQKIEKNIVLITILLFAIFYFPIQVVTKVIDNGITIFHLPVSFTAFIFFVLLTLRQEILIVVPIIIFSILYWLITYDEAQKVKEIKKKINGIK